VGASIAILGRFDLTHTASTRHFLLDRCQHKYIGGFAKVPDSHPDVLHTFYSLAWLAISGERHTHPIDPTLGLRLSKSREFLARQNKQEQQQEQQEQVEEKTEEVNTGRNSSESPFSCSGSS
jgi:prenyltransferase beta subunit